MTEALGRSLKSLSSRAFLTEWLLLGGSLLLLGALTIYGQIQSYRDIGERERERLLNQAQVVDADLSRHLDAVSHVLTILQSEWAYQKAQKDGLETIGRQLHSFVEAMPAVRSLAILDANGTIVASNRAPLVNSNFRDRPYFQAPRQKPDARTLYVSPPLKTVLGAFAMSVSRVVLGARGEFAGVIVATLDPDQFMLMMRSVRYAPDMGVGLNHGDGTIIITATHPEFAGRSLAKPGSFYTQHVDSGRKESFFEGEIALTGEHRLVALLTIQPPRLNMDKPLMVAVSRQTSALYGPWREHVYEQLGLYGLLVASTVAGLLFYQRRRRVFQREAAQSAARLADSERTLRTIVDSQPQCVMILAPDGAIAQINRVGLAMLEADCGDEVVGSAFVDLVAAPHRDAFRDLCARVGAGASASLVFEVVGRKGGQRWLETHVVPMRNGEGEITGQLGVALDVTERRGVEQELERLSQTDALTNLANRRHFMAQAEQEVSRATRYGGSLSVAMLDIDHFKSVNDTYGHKVGDAALKTFGRLCREALRDIDIVGRVGGEEFAVLLPQTGGEQAMEVAERLRKLIAKTEIHLEQGLPLHFTVSIGVATLQGSGANLDTLLNHADTALYEAKRSGRNRVCLSALA